RRTSRPRSSAASRRRSKCGAPWPTSNASPLPRLPGKVAPPRSGRAGWGELSLHMRYLALGDSYTIGTGASDDSHAWPSIIASRLGADLTNPAVNGYTSLDLIREELPFLGRVEHDFVSILIGVNDLVQGTSAERYRDSLVKIYDAVAARPARAAAVSI